MFVSDVMKTSVVTVEPSTTLADAARMMLAQHISGLPVLDAGRLVGIVTEGDLLKRVELGTEVKTGWFKAFFLPDSLAHEYVITHGLHVRDVMTPNPISVTPDTKLADVAEIMSKRRIKRLPVLENNSLAGVVSRTDLLQILVRQLIDTREPLTETQIKDHILSAIDGERWAPRSGIRVTVTGGVVSLDGTVFSAEEQNAVRVIAETTPGVKEVHDRLVFVDPASGMAIPIS